MGSGSLEQGLASQCSSLGLGPGGKKLERGRASIQGYPATLNKALAAAGPTDCRHNLE
jgi:hypothetical protein